MKYSEKLADDELVGFIYRGQRAVVGGKGNRGLAIVPGFNNWEYEEGGWKYRMLRLGYEQMQLMVMVEKEKQLRWMYHLTGKMEKVELDIKRAAMKMLNKVLVTDNPGTKSFRGPGKVILGKWVYEYRQQGKFGFFSGKEKLTYDKKLVYRANIVGGLVKEKEV